MSFLQVTTNEGRIYTALLSKNETAIGRSAENDIVLRDHTVSRFHARIVRTKKGYVITDLGSFNGTQLNERSIQTALLANRDRIRIGLAQMVFLNAEKPPSLKPDTVILSDETDFESGRESIVTSSPEAWRSSSLDLLVPADAKKSSGGTGNRLKESLPSLRRSNKVLYVLYEISRQLNSIYDFNQLLTKIMDLVFVVIEADHGFLILTGDEGKDELIPVVVKSRDGLGQDAIALKASRTMINRVIHDKVALLTSDAMDDSRLNHAKSLVVPQVRSAMCVPLWKKNRIIGVIQLESVRPGNRFTQDDLELLKAIGSQMAMVIEQASLNEQIREKERLRNRLERFHSPQVIDLILKADQEAKDNFMEPNYLTATILFTDINGFTRLSERLPPSDVNIILNQYFSRMTDIIFRHDGTLDKYIGDGMMAVFGAPIVKEDDAERAIRAAKEMVNEMKSLMKDAGDERKFTIRIGINTGWVMAGNIGSPKRMDYTVIGDAVNVASRLESMAQPNQILIGEGTYRLVKDKFNIRAVGPKQVKGKREEIRVYEVL
jgi:adenylate cyclase